MKKISIQIRSDGSQRAYNIFVGKGLLKRVASLIPHNGYTKAVVVTDNNIPAMFVNTIRRSVPMVSDIVTLPAGEEHKNLKSIQKIWEKLHEYNCDRTSLLITIGGGVICDMGGFAASTYMRGIDVLQIPTTLAAQVDAGFGGKTGINFCGIKNLVGTFHQPIGVITDIETLSTLPKREFVSGFGEIIKHGLICDSKYFQFATSKRPGKFTQKEMVSMIERSCEIKARIVMRDEMEADSRKLLNFGHTVGHAIEALSQTSKHPLLHGEAVLIGMLIETRLSLLMGLLSQTSSSTIKERLRLLSIAKLPDTITIPSILKTIQSDKKSKNGIVQWTLLKAVGLGVINQHVDTSLLTQALQQTKGKCT